MLWLKKYTVIKLLHCAVSSGVCIVSVFLRSADSIFFSVVL